MTNGEEIKLISFILDDKEYAVDIKLVQEVIEEREITPVPKSPDYMEGVIDLRGHIIPIINLRKMLGFKDREKTLDNRIIIVEVSGGTLGIVIDSVKEVLTVHKFDMESVPQLQDSREKLEFLQAVAKIKERLVLIFDLNKILNEEQLKELEKEEIRAEEKKEEALLMQVISFFIADECYGLDTKFIQEIIILPKITRVPNTPNFLKGVINLRGNIVSVIDIREFLGLPKKDYTPSTRTIVTISNGEFAGVIIDSVHQVLKFPKDSVEPPISTLEGKRGEYVLGVKREDSGLLILVNFEKLIQDIKETLEK